MVVDRLLYDDDKHLTRAETTGVIDNLLKEVDNDEDGAICFPEFQQAMQKVITYIMVIVIKIALIIHPILSFPIFLVFGIRLNRFYHD